MIRSQAIQTYFAELNEKVALAYQEGSRARRCGIDPKDVVEVPLAKNMAERVEGLVSVKAPQLKGRGVVERIHALEDQYGKLDWRVALKIAEEVATEKFCTFENKVKAIEAGAMTGFAYITLGVVSSPLEGITEIRVKKRRDHKEYLAVFYAGPVRSAGGTGAAVSLLICSYLGKKLGYSPYDPTPEEVKRMETEVYDYHERINNLQYLPSRREIEFLVAHMPIQVDGEPSEEKEVSNYKDLDRIETNNIRGGACLVIGECIAQKAPKVWVQVNNWGKDFELDDWNFLGEFVELQKEIKAKHKPAEQKDAKIKPDYTFIKDLVAGRPVLSGPLTIGGLRLRYGRCRISGYSATCIHPATMRLLDGYIATGTQLKMERPGKASVMMPCDTIDGPVVKLHNGSVMRIDTVKEAEQVAKEVKEILFLGDILVSYGDFYNRAHPLVPAGYCEEWWVQEVQQAATALLGNFSMQDLAAYLHTDVTPLQSACTTQGTNPCVSAELALLIAKTLKVPLHPYYTYYWTAISSGEAHHLIRWFSTHSRHEDEENKITKVVLPFDPVGKRTLELIGCPHDVVGQEYVIVKRDHAQILSAVLTPLQGVDLATTTILELFSQYSFLEVRDKSGTFIGARMGRPEKAKMRKLTGSPHMLFPVGDEGGRLRCIQAAMEVGKIEGDFAVFYCMPCRHQTVLGVCEQCGQKTQRLYRCNICGDTFEPICQKHGPCASSRKTVVPIAQLFQKIIASVNLKAYPDLIKGVRGTSNKDHIAEHPLKGVLRAKHDLFVNKDGTIRYDMTQLPLTHFTPREIGTSLEILRKLGYEHDMSGTPLTTEDQLLEIKPQDVILPLCEGSPEIGSHDIIMDIARFIDDELTVIYNSKPFYHFSSPQDIIGHLVVILAPHTSAGIIGRIIGFSNTQGLFAHPLLHAATRRDCDGDEACFLLLMDCFLNFSREFLPAHRGSTQDAPLVITCELIPGEVDDMAFDLDVCASYPLELYQAALRYESPRSLKLERLGKRLNTPGEYEGMKFTHHTSNLNAGINCSAYKTLPSMEEKLKGQMELAEKIRAVDPSDVARLVLEKHFIKDIRGNLRKFSTQEFRCVKCNEKFRRPPLVGKCTACGGKLLFTVSEGSVIKYLEPSLSLARKYKVSPYLLQTLELTKHRIESQFGKEKERQEGLGKWFG
ncbi:DNA polymerase II large subunit [Candidatus Woesearchaeota archaeon]|nr:DNA polymerase II large subunit [Candidatus Woesearchaeota archaeon]